MKATWHVVVAGGVKVKNPGEAAASGRWLENQILILISY